MLRPSYTELMDLLNKSDNMDSQITSRYTIVMAVAKRARQLIAGAGPLASGSTDKAVSIAIEEMKLGKLDITPMRKDENPSEKGGDGKDTF